MLENAGKNAGSEAVSELTHETLPEVQQILLLLAAKLDELSASTVRRIQTELLTKVEEVIQGSEDRAASNLHGVLDRLHNTKLVVSAFSVTLQIPPKE